MFELDDTYVDEQFVDDTLQLDKIMVEVIGLSKRRRPIKGETLKAMEKAFGKWGWIQAGGAGGDGASGMEELAVTKEG